MVTFRYYGDRSKSQHTGIITAAIERQPDCTLVGVALCSPKDKFSKKRGREIADGRLHSRHCYAIPYTNGLALPLLDRIDDDFDVKWVHNLCNIIRQQTLFLLPLPQGEPNEETSTT